MEQARRLYRQKWLHRPTTQKAIRTAKMFLKDLFQPSRTWHEEKIRQETFLRSLYPDVPKNKLGNTPWEEPKTLRQIEAHIVVEHLSPLALSIIYGPIFDLLLLKKLGAIDSIQNIRKVVLAIMKNENDLYYFSFGEYVPKLGSVLRTIDLLLDERLKHLDPVDLPFDLPGVDQAEIVKFKHEWAAKGPPPIISASSQ